MTDCTIRGCRNLEWKCADCGRVAMTAAFFRADGWISAKDRLPEEGLRVLTILKNEYFPEYKLDYIVDLGHEKIWACILADEFDRVTHWMFLPEPPEES
jgi:hypothetical protein